MLYLFFANQVSVIMVVYEVAISLQHFLAKCNFYLFINMYYVDLFVCVSLFYMYVLILTE